MVEFLWDQLVGKYTIHGSDGLLIKDQGSTITYSRTGLLLIIVVGGQIFLVCFFFCF